MQSIVEAAKIHREATKHDGLSAGQDTCRGRRQGVEEDRNRDRDRNVSGPAYYDFYRSVTAEGSKEGENRENHKKERA